MATQCCEPEAISVYREMDDDGSRGRFIHHSWPGCYPVVYYTTDGEMLCPKCANRDNGSLARTCDGPDDAPRDGWKIVAADVYWEGPTETCVHCSRDIESAYGDPDAGESAND
jgi:hypothetical protein